jgi:hypothetical protein
VKKSQDMCDNSFHINERLTQENADLAKRLESSKKLEDVLDDIIKPDGVCHRLVDRVTQRDNTIKSMDEDMTILERSIRQDMCPAPAKARDLFPHGCKMKQEIEQLEALLVRRRDMIADCAHLQDDMAKRLANEANVSHNVHDIPEFSWKS